LFTARDASKHAMIQRAIDESPLKSLFRVVLFEDAIPTLTE